MQQSRVERILKGGLKGRLRVTQSLLVAFLITGSVLHAAPKEKQREEKEVLLFINGMIQDGGGSGSNQKVSKKLEKPGRPIGKPITPGIDPNRPIDGFDPITPEVDLQRPIDKFDPVTPEVDPQRPIDKFDPITPEVKPQRPIDSFDPITPEVPLAPIIIWKNGQEIRGQSYTLTDDLEVENYKNPGLETKGGEVINKATITVPYLTYTAMKVKDDGIGINEGTITGEGWGMVVESGTITNQGTISTDNGMKVEKSTGTAINEISGTIKSTWGNTPMYAVTGTAINKGTLKGIDNGMYANGASAHVVNEGKIEVGSGDLQSEAMLTHKGTATNQGLLEGAAFRGMATFYAGTIINEGTIATGGVTGMQVDRGGLAINEVGGIIANKGSSRMSINYTSTSGADYSSSADLINKGTLDTENDRDFTVMEADGKRIKDETLKDFSAINEGEIKLLHNNSIGMYGRGENTVIVNKGVINVNSDNSIAMKVEEEATAVNEGTINLNGNTGVGMYVDSTSTYTNTGTINIAAGTTGNQKIVTEGGAKIVNSGSIVAEGEFDSGEGKLIMSSGGTLEAGSVKNDIYASGALARGDFEDAYSTYKMLKTNNLEGDVISNSAMFDAKVTENADENGYYDIELVRKDFNELLANGEVGEILEDNYKNTGNELKEDYYDALKLLSTNKELNQATNDTFGIGYFEGVAKQSLDTVKTTRKVIKNNIFSEAGNRSVGDVIAIGGIDATTTEIDGSGNLTGYDYDLYSIYFGVDKQIASEWRIGAVGTVGKGEADYGNANDKSDDIYQGTFYALYEGEFKLNTMLYLGQIDSDLERNVNFADWNKKYEDKTDTKFIGLDTAISKRYNLNNFYIEPKAEVNMTYFRQDGVQEQGEGGVSIDSQDYYSIETGIGGAIGRTFLKEKLIIEGSMMVYSELGDPYKDQESKVNDLFEGDKVKINSYQGNDYYADLGVNVGYKVMEPLKINLGGSYITGEEEDNWSINIGLKYVM